MQAPLANCVPNRLFHTTRLARLDNGGRSRFAVYQPAKTPFTHWRCARTAGGGRFYG